MKKEEIEKEYMVEVGEFNHVPIMLKKDDNSGNRDEPDLTRITQNSVIEAIKKVQDEFQV